MTSNKYVTGMASGGGLAPGTTYTLKLGSTWDKIPSDLIHAVQYDFKPASIDPSQPGQMKLEGNNGVALSLPHKDTDESSEFKGNKQPALKDCFLVVDKVSNTVYLEKVSNMIRVKKHRSIKRKKIAPRKEDERASPTYNAESPDPISTPPPPPSSVQQNIPPELTAAVREEPTVLPLVVPDSEPKTKPLNQPTFASSGNLSSESSGSESESSSDSDNDELMHKIPTDPVKKEELLNVGESSGVLITPLGEPNIKQEGVASGDALMNMLSQDLDISSSDADSD